MMNHYKLPISQIFKLVILLLLLIRLSLTKDFIPVLLVLSLFLIGPIHGFILTSNLNNFINDFIVGTKWANVPISFFYFKILFQSKHYQKLIFRIRRMIVRSFKFVSLNLLLGALGFGMAFYNHGFANAIGTKGYIYAGNELTVLLLSLGFVIASYLFLKKEFKKYFLFFFLFFFFSYLMISKTILIGVLIVFLIPVLSVVKMKFKVRFIKNIFLATLFLVPILTVGAIIGIQKSGLLDRIKNSLIKNDFDWVTVILSNRNNFIRKGWQVFIEDFSVIGKLFGYGQSYHLELSGHLAEVDFFTILFSSGVVGLFGLIILNLYWLKNAIYFKNKNNIFASSVLIFLFFLIIVANLSGHIFGSGIAGFFIGFSIALMFYKKGVELEGKI